MANTVIYNGIEYKNTTAVKNQMRKEIMEICVNALIEHFGEDAVAKIGTNEYACIVGTITSEGFPLDAVATIKPTVKEWEDRRTDKKEFKRFDFDYEKADYEKKLKEKEEKEKEKKEAKEKKIARDKAERARKAQEKADKAKAEAEAK